MGVFAENQSIYARHGIATFPTQTNDGRKRPAIKGYTNIGIPASCQLAMKFTEADAFAFMAGRRTRLSVVDIDSPDDDLLRDTLRRYGETPIITRTPSGGRHLWYRHNGEGRRIRPEAQVPVDLLGGGVVIAPPSMGARGLYQFEHGTLDDLDSLRPAQNVIEFPKPKLVRADLPPAGLITEGRNGALYRHLMKAARYCDDLDALMDVAFTFAQAMIDRTARHPFTDTEIAATTRQVFEITARGDNRFGGKPHSILLNETRDTLHQLGADAFFLHSVLQAWSGGKALFPIANGMADHMPGGKWPVRRMQAARAALIGSKIVREVRKANGAQGAAVYAWG